MKAEKFHFNRFNLQSVPDLKLEQTLSKMVELTCTECKGNFTHRKNFEAHLKKQQCGATTEVSNGHMFFYVDENGKLLFNLVEQVKLIHARYLN